MKIAAIIIRTLMGLMFLYASVVVLFKLMPQPELKGDVKTFMTGVNASIYLMPLIMATQFICAVAFLSGRFVTLAVVVIFPIIINILLFHAFLSPNGLPTAILLLLGDLFLAYYYRKNYIMLFAAK